MRRTGDSNCRVIGTACGLLALSSLLGGCAAAVAVPVLAAGGVFAGSQGRGGLEQDEPVIRPVEEPRIFAGELPAPSAVSPSAPQPLPNERIGAGDWQSFKDYALDRSRALGGPEPVASALLTPGSRLELPDRLPCTNLASAVIVDLDPAGTAFAPQSALQPAPGLAESLAQLRGAGVTVMWVSKADANEVSEIGNALRSSGLDPAGKDPLLLVRNPAERKQVMRTEASKTACIVAIAGDQRSDFDELFDYLRNPDAAAGLDIMLGDGWFLTPMPFATPAADPQT